MLANRHVIAVAGTHGKTTTSAMIAAILDAAGCEPGFLIGGVPLDFVTSARVGVGGPRGLFVIEADEYDTAFFDKRSKFVHYRPRTLVLNNLEFDHADIFSDLRDMQRQFHHLVRIVPATGRILAGAGHAHLEEVLEMGCWTEVERVGNGADWSATSLAPDGRRFDVCERGRVMARVEWEQRGAHNVSNALAAIAAARHVGVDPADAARALRRFRGVRRRLEHLDTTAGISLYDDFAHHPTAIRAAIDSLHGDRAGRVLAVLEPASNTMRLGTHRETLWPFARGRARRVGAGPGSRRMGCSRAGARARECAGARRHRWHRAGVLRGGSPRGRDSRDEQRRIRRNSRTAAVRDPKLRRGAGGVTTLTLTLGPRNGRQTRA